MTWNIDLIKIYYVLFKTFSIRWLFNEMQAQIFSAV